ncbi:DnaJ-class molecular chaperone [Janthinobacterium sp. CG_23.3]|uniref:hypothetical protein n=1 Tax=unclassified Janthinobacterium TaxID=2610881 RepID=UPI00034D7E2C|nr:MULTISPECIES: hypothetical protein [unclassified Janthinobacterium]MEC5161843.1 DnaJ-class molecular chaperone [Janthinobacterium sp. CG_S6]
MGFSEQFIASLSSRDLRDDEFHHDLDAIGAAARAGDLGALLCRVKYADGSVNRLSEGNSGNLAQLLRVWTAKVGETGRTRRWAKANTAWDIQAANTLYRRVAEASLAHWLDGKCKRCGGTGIAPPSRRVACAACQGSGDAPVSCPGSFEREKIKEMVGELEGLLQTHGARAARLLGRRRR